MFSLPKTGLFVFHMNCPWMMIKSTNIVVLLLWLSSWPHYGAHFPMKILNHDCLFHNRIIFTIIFKNSLQSWKFLQECLFPLLSSHRPFSLLFSLDTDKATMNKSNEDIRFVYSQIVQPTAANLSLRCRFFTSSEENLVVATQSVITVYQTVEYVDVCKRVSLLMNCCRMASPTTPWRLVHSTRSTERSSQWSLSPCPLWKTPLRTTIMTPSLSPSNTTWSPS